MWADERLVGFDLETTSPDPEVARIVSAAIVKVGGGQPMVTRSCLVNPGVEIPAEATEVHGITNERVRLEGEHPRAATMAIIDHLAEAAAQLWPIVIVNARYDLTVLDREARRNDLVPLIVKRPGLRVIDPLVLDKWLHRYRPGSRRLVDTCAHHNVVLSSAHEAHADALAGCKLAWRLGHGGEVIRRTRDAAELADYHDLRARWEASRYDLDALHQLQVEVAAEQARGLQEYFRAGNPKKDLAPDPDAYVEPAWPLIPAVTSGAHEAV